MTPDQKTFALPILLVAIGAVWLLTTLGIAPGMYSVCTLCLMIVGVLASVIGGFDKVTIVVGAFFIITSCVSMLRRTGRISIDAEIPILVITVGILLLVARHPSIPIPKWIMHSPNKNENEGVGRANITPNKQTHLPAILCGAFSYLFALAAFGLIYLMMEHAVSGRLDGWIWLVLLLYLATIGIGVWLLIVSWRYGSGVHRTAFWPAGLFLAAAAFPILSGLLDAPLMCSSQRFETHS